MNIRNKHKYFAYNRKAKKPLWLRALKAFGVLTLAGILTVAGVSVWAIVYYGRDLPDYRQLAEYEPAVVTRIHAGDGSLLTEYSRQPRLFVPINAIPERLKEAFISAEDKNFYSHFGLDILGIVRAALNLPINYVRGRRMVGASTITQQVARNFLLTLDQKFDRKFKEMILTLRIERAFTKDQILELYLNEINMGNRSYGVAAAALNYFNKSLTELTNAEMAYLAALPKAPHNYHPVRHYSRAIARRNWVLSRMFALNFITPEEYEIAKVEDLVMREKIGEVRFKADYFEEAVRRKVNNKYGNKTLYEGGLSVRTTLEPRLQAMAEKALRQGLELYDRRHGWRGAVTKLTVSSGWKEQLSEINRPVGMLGWQHALVYDLQGGGAIIGLKDGSHGFISMKELKWARQWRPGEKLGPAVRDVTDVVNIGDVIAVEALEKADQVKVTDFYDDYGNKIDTLPQFSLKQVPAIEGAIVVLDPHTGRVLAIVGGFDYEISQFNRAIQAERQPGSAFKPFVYAAALDADFTPSSLILDAPFVMDQGYGLGKWKPVNSTNKFYGPSTLRTGLEKSRNLMTVRLAQNIGMGRVIRFAKRFGIADHMEQNLAMSLGAGEVTLLKLTAAYGMLANGGKHIEPSLIDRIQDRRGKTIYRHDTRPCETCGYKIDEFMHEPDVIDNREQVIDKRNAYQLVSMLEGVTQRGTAKSFSWKFPGRPLAGKTGTTNDAADAWFVGFSPDLVVGVFTGFDRPRSLGQFEEGSTVAAPIFIEFMKQALKDKPVIPFRIPEGIRLVRVNPVTGQPARPNEKNVILEAFIPGTEPGGGKVVVLDGSLPVGQTDKGIRKGTGGIY